MEYIEIIVAALCATSTMTLFSYLISESFRKLYKEPLLMQFLMTSFDVELSGRQKVIASWLIHYFIGLLFVVCYYLPVWLECSWYTISMMSGLLFGCIIGGIGIAGWEIMFKLSQANPPVDRKGYYLQLFVAHVIFGLTTAVIHLGFMYYLTAVLSK